MPSWTIHPKSGCRERPQTRLVEKLPRRTQPKFQIHESVSCFCFKSLSLRTFFNQQWITYSLKRKLMEDRACVPCASLSHLAVGSVILQQWVQSCSHLEKVRTLTESGIAPGKATQRSPNEPLYYNDGSLKEKLTLPQTVDCCRIQNPSLFCDLSDVTISSCILHLNLKIHFHWENVALKWAMLWSISFCSLQSG